MGRRSGSRVRAVDRQVVDARRTPRADPHSGAGTAWRRGLPVPHRCRMSLIVAGRKAALALPGVEGAAVEDGTLRPAYAAMRSVTRLRRVGGMLAVYGYRETPTRGATKAQAERQLARAHIVNPGSYTVPQVPNHPMAGESGLAHALALCGIPVVTNGYAADFTPPELELCPVCAKTN